MHKPETAYVSIARSSLPLIRRERGLALWLKLAAALVAGHRGDGAIGVAREVEDRGERPQIIR
jgi:hypothetical protein